MKFHFSLVPKNDKFEKLLIEAIEVAYQAATLFEQMLTDYPNQKDLAVQIKDLEHQGDKVMRRMVRELNQTFITPIDREDIYKLAQTVDDIIDYIDEASAMFNIYSIDTPRDEAIKLSKVLVEATKTLKEAMPNLNNPTQMENHWNRVHELEDQGDDLVRQGIKSVFETCEPLVVIAWKDIYAQFEEAIDACEKASTVLEAIAVKSGN